VFLNLEPLIGSLLGVTLLHERLRAAATRAEITCAFHTSMERFYESKGCTVCDAARIILGKCSGTERSGENARRRFLIGNQDSTIYNFGASHVSQNRRDAGHPH
jgi:hypothetical protein